MSRPLIIVAGGGDDEREEIVRTLFDALQIRTRTDGREPRVHSFGGDPDGITYPPGWITSY